MTPRTDEALADDAAVVVLEPLPAPVRPSSVPDAGGWGDIGTEAVRDPWEHARVLIARKLSTLLPGQDFAAKRDLGDSVLATLREVVRNEVRRVHQEVADVLGDIPGDPRGGALSVMEEMYDPTPGLVRRLSALLSAEDVLGLLGATPGWARNVADGGGTITSLLENDVASIRESALDALADPAASHPAYRRPLLSDRTARALSGFVVGHLLERLAKSPSVSPSLRQALRRRLEGLLAAEAILMLRTPDIREAMDIARRLKDEHRLNEEALLAAVQRGEARMATAILAVASGLPVPAVDWATTLRSAKGLVSLVWKAGFSMRVAVPLQTLLARLSPASVLRPTPGNGFPLSVEEMRWQIEFLQNMGR